MKQYAIPSITKERFQNPLTIENKGDLPEEECRINGDPFVLKYNGEYFCYSTGKKNVNILHSQDLIHFEHLGGCLLDEGRYDFWAPCVIYLNGKFYMYYSSNPQGINDDHAHCLRVAAADTPYGPFIFQKQLLDLFSIDPHAVKSETGDLIMFYSANNYSGTDRNFAGTIILVDEMTDPFTLAGSPRPAVMPSMKEEMFMENRFGDGRDWYTIEGAFYIKKRETEYLMYSANAFTDPSYFIGYASTKSSPGLSGNKWNKYPNDMDYDPLICQNDKVMGTGHNSVVKAPNNVDEWIVYHGNDKKGSASEIPSNREMRIDPILFGKNRMYTVAPSSDWMDAPMQPSYKNLCRNGLKNEIFEAGDWSTDWEGLHQKKRNTIARCHIKDIKAENYIFEVSLRWQAIHIGGRYGAYAAYQDNCNNVQVIINEGEKTIELYSVQNGCGMLISSARLERDFKFDVFHKLTIKRTAALFLIYMDDVFYMKGKCSIRESSVGLITYYTGADYASLEVTEYLELNKENAQEFAGQTKACKDTPEKNWIISGDEITGYAIDSDRLLIMQEKTRYRFSANLEQLVRKKSLYSGVYAAYFDEDNYIAVVLNVLERKTAIRSCECGIIKEQLIDTEDFESNTSITVMRYDNRLIIMLGAITVFDEEIWSKECCCGLYAELRTKFSGIEFLVI